MVKGRTMRATERPGIPGILREMNRVTLVGRLTKDVETRQTTGGKTVANFSIAVSKRFKTDGEPDADFFNVVAWGQSAEYASDYGSKGRLTAVDGRLQSRKYTTQDGSQREVVEVIAESVSFLDKPKDYQPSPSVNNSADSGYDPFEDE